MPTYDFYCEKCQKEFTLQISLADYEQKKYECPDCKGTNIRQQITQFQAITSKKS